MSDIDFEVDENEIISLLGTNDEEIKDLIYAKYGYIIDILLKKYRRIIKALQIDMQELRCEAYYGFSDGINSYSDNKNASLRTFLTICIERRITKYIKKHSTKKSMFQKESLSLEMDSEYGLPLLDALSDDNKYNPLYSLTSNETVLEIIEVIKDKLSDFEYQVFTYMLKDLSYKQIAVLMDKNPKQIDNTIQRIKLKLRKALDEI